MHHFHVRIASDELVFNAAHFISFEADTCEPLHGHSYRVAAEVHGPLDENHCVVDFLVVHDMLRKIVGELDHHVLLPTEHPRIHVAAGRQEVEVTCGRQRWVFPRPDCLLLPIPNTTTELLARHLGQRLLDELRSRFDTQPELVSIQLEQCPGISAVCELRGG